MKKIRSILSIMLVCILAFSLCACSLVDTVKSATYNTGDLEDDYKIVKKIDGVEFAIKESWLNEAENSEDGEFLYQYNNRAFVIIKEEGSDRYLVLVGEVECDYSLGDIESAKDVEKYLTDDVFDDVVVGNSYAKTDVDGVVKVIVSMENDEYVGYVALMENSDGRVYTMLVASEKEDDTEILKYTVKSLEYTGESLANKNASAENEDDDDEYIDDDNRDDYDDEDGEDDEDRTTTTQKENVTTTTKKETTTTNKVTTTTTKQQSTTTTKKPQSGNVSYGEWTDMVITIDGVTYQFPYDYDKLKSNGWSFDLADYGKEGGYILNPGDSVASTIKLTNSKYGESYRDFYIYCGFKNASSTAKDITECEIWKLELDCLYGSSLKEKYPTVEIYKGITFGSSEQEIIKAFGEPTDTYVSESLNYKTYTYRTSDFSSYAKFTIHGEYGVTSIAYYKY